MAKQIEHVFKLHSKWSGGRNDIGEIQCGNLQTTISIPSEMDGPGVGTNPDEMLLGAAATCYMISLATMLEYSKIKANLSLQSEGLVEVNQHVYTYKQITHYIKIHLLEEATDRKIKTVQRLAKKAEQSCMISKALKGNVEIVVNCIIIDS